MFQINKHPRIKEVKNGLSVHHISKHYKKRPVLRDISFSIERGEAVALLGPNGAGKTTCFHIMTGLIECDGGSILLDGQEITNMPMYARARLGVGYLPQEASIFRGLSVEENVRSVVELQKIPKNDQALLLEDLLTEFGLDHLRRAPATALSGGERRRVEIARALAARPQFILLDEPLAGIDPIAVGDIRDLISHLKDRGIGVLITDHNVRDCLGVVDRAYILHDGKVMMQGTAEEIINHDDVKRVYLGEGFSL